jgi:hypothetical protein
LSNPTNKAAAEACNISESALYKRLKDPEFKKEYDKARLELLDRNTCAIQSIVNSAIAAMAEIVQDEDTTAQVRLNAADAILRNCYRMTEQNDILKRLDDLEQAIQEEQYS